MIIQLRCFRYILYERIRKFMTRNFSFLKLYGSSLTAYRSKWLSGSCSRDDVDTYQLLRLHSARTHLRQVYVSLHRWTRSNLHHSVKCLDNCSRHVTCATSRHRHHVCSRSMSLSTHCRQSLTSTSPSSSTPTWWGKEDVRSANGMAVFRCILRQIRRLVPPCSHSPDTGGSVGFVWTRLDYDNEGCLRGLAY